MYPISGKMNKPTLKLPDNTQYQESKPKLLCDQTLLESDANSQGFNDEERYSH
jgi:hypothetical protein